MRPGPWALCRVSRVFPASGQSGAWLRTDDERNHAGAIPAGGFKTLDQLLDLPHLNVLLGLAALPLGLGGHGCGCVGWTWVREGGGKRLKSVLCGLPLGGVEG